MKRTKKRVRKFSHEQLSRILSMAASGLICTDGGYWTEDRVRDSPFACPLQAAHNEPHAGKAAKIDPGFALSFDAEATVFPISHAWHPTAEEMLDFAEKMKRA
jgi:hypothetical protein